MNPETDFDLIARFGTVTVGENFGSTRTVAAEYEKYRTQYGKLLENIAATQADVELSTVGKAERVKRLRREFTVSREVLNRARQAVERLSDAIRPTFGEVPPPLQVEIRDAMRRRDEGFRVSVYLDAANGRTWDAERVFASVYAAPSVEPLVSDKVRADGVRARARRLEPDKVAELEELTHAADALEKLLTAIDEELHPKGLPT